MQRWLFFELLSASWTFAECKRTSHSWQFANNPADQLWREDYFGSSWRVVVHASNSFNVRFPNGVPSGAGSPSPALWESPTAAEKKWHTAKLVRTPEGYAFQIDLQVAAAYASITERPSR
jgi:hypothetical protein